MSITENFLGVRSLKWFYREGIPNTDSDRPPVLFLHGLPAQSLTWCELMPGLAEKGLRAIAPDWIGSGFSAKPERRDFAYTADAYLEALSAFIEALALEKLSVVVQGFVGSVGIQYALRHPDAIDRLVILNAPLSSTAKLPWQMRQWGLPLIGDMLTQDPLLVDRTLEGGSGFVIADKTLEIYRKPFLTTSASGRALVATIQNLKLTEAMAQIETGLSNWTKPTLIIWGMADPWLSADSAEQLASAKDNIELFKLKAAKHYPQEHWSKEISSVLTNFLRRQTS